MSRELPGPFEVNQALEWLRAGAPAAHRDHDPREHIRTLAQLIDGLPDYFPAFCYGTPEHLKAWNKGAKEHEARRRVVNRTRALERRVADLKDRLTRAHERLAAHAKVRRSGP